MPERRSRTFRHLLILPVALFLGGCTGLGTLEDILAAGGGYGSDLRGEVSLIDSRRREIELRSDWGRPDLVRYDGRTEVFYRDRRYSVNDLERGDLVRVRLDVEQGTPYARLIEVERSVREGDGSSFPGGRIQRLDGTVVRIDTQRGWFELEQSRGSVLVVTLPYEANRSLQDRFRRLRRGDRVRIEG